MYIILYTKLNKSVQCTLTVTAHIYVRCSLFTEEECLFLLLALEGFFSWGVGNLGGTLIFGFVVANCKSGGEEVESREQFPHLKASL